MGATTPGTDLALMKKGVVDVVESKVAHFLEKGELNLPANYSPQNSMKSAWLILQNTVDKDKKPVLSVCTRDSIANSLLDMVVQGLNPAKKQCYFIAYGNKLVCQRSYFGAMSVAKEVAGASEIDAQVVYKGDEFEYALVKGKKQIVKHVQKLENVDAKNIVAAYCIITFEDGREIADIMTIDQIKKAWLKSKNNASSDTSVHSQFAEEMCKRTVINRACKALINSSSDSNLFLEKFNRADETIAEVEVEQEIAENANGEVIDVEYSDGDVPFESDPEEEEQARAEAEAAATEETPEPEKPKATAGKGKAGQQTIAGEPDW